MFDTFRMGNGSKITRLFEVRKLAGSAVRNCHACLPVRSSKTAQARLGLRN